MITVGVTGGIASGKSTVCERLTGLGARMFHADAEARELMVHDADVRAGVIAALGAEAYAPDGGLNKTWIADRIFGSEADRRALEAVVHPAVGVRFRAAKQAAEVAGCPMLVKEQAVFPNEAARADVDHWVVVEATPGARLDRAARRAGQSPDQARARMQAQPDATTYRSIADTVIVNDGTLEDLRARVDDLWETLTGRPAHA
ncbi:MAG: dephospho-CoA kinase [Rhodothermales bacterium]